MGDAFERELRALLAGDEQALEKMVNTCDEAEERGYLSIRKRPFLVIRAAGSFGMDLVAIWGDLALPIEVKSSKSDVLWFSNSKRLLEQAESIKEDCTKTGLVPVYAFRLKGFRGDPWRVFSLPVDEANGRLKLIQRKLPLPEESKNGNYIMRWENGLKLSSFVEYLIEIGNSD